MPTKTHETPNEHPRNVQRNTPLGVGADSSCPYPYIIKYTYSFHQIRVFTLSNMRFRSSFCGCLRICGHDKSDPYSCERIAISLLTVCNNVANIPRNAHERSVKCPHSPTKCPRNTPPGVGVDSSRPYPCIIKYTYSFHQICISVSSYTNIHIIKYAFPFLVSWVFTYMRAR